MTRRGVVVIDGVNGVNGDGRRPAHTARTRSELFTTDASRGTGVAVGRHVRSLPRLHHLLLSSLVLLPSLLVTRASVTVAATATPSPLASSRSLGGAEAAFLVEPSTWTGQGLRGGWRHGVFCPLHRPQLRPRLARSWPPPKAASRIRMVDGNGGDGGEEVRPAAKSGGTARFVGIDTSTTTTTAGTTTAGSIVDSVLSVLASDVGNIALGSLGLLACLTNRLLYVPDESALSSGVMGGQSRADLLAVFASISVLLNGVSRLDVTSALAETVVLDGVEVGLEVTDSGRLWLHRSRGEDDGGGEALLGWALSSAIASTPAETAVLVVRRRRRGVADGDGDDGTWEPGAFAGVVPPAALARSRMRSGDDDGGGTSASPAPATAAVAIRTPILDRFLRDPNGSRRETYLPTLQALPGRVEFTTTYLPGNAQEALLIPVTLPDRDGEASGVVAEGEADEEVVAAVLVLASGTAKSFSPRDVARCQVLASRMDGFGPGSQADAED